MRTLYLHILICSLSIQLFVTALKCELKGMIDNKVQCILYDRGKNTKDRSLNKTKSGQSPEEIKSWKYSKGLDCNKTFFTGEIEDFKSYVKMMLPNSLWCGDSGGLVPTSYEDLKLFLQTDKCCKNHNACEDIIEAKEQKYGLLNRGILQRFHCNCEKLFYDCLKKIEIDTTQKVGFTYFNIFGPQCFREDNPVINCTKQKAGRCTEYKFNRKENKTYQWFDVPMY